jgi:DNA-binding GntR family transcriptional regulator
MTSMSAKARDDLSEAALAEVLAASGVNAGPEDIGPVARSVARIRDAAVALRPPSFDDTNERFYRLLEDDGAEAGA